MPILHFIADVDEELAEAILATGRTKFDLATIFGGNGDDPNAPAIADYVETTLVTTLSDIEDAAAEADRKARPWVVGETVNPGVIERFATHDEAAEFIQNSFDPEDVQAGVYYIDGPPED